jgi:hypothetical protein
MRLKLRREYKDFPMRLLPIAIALLTATAGFADTITLRDGTVLNGTFLGGTARQVRMEVGDQIRSFEISEVTKIDFGSMVPQAIAPAPLPPPTAAAPVQTERPVLRRNENVMRPSDTASATPPVAASGPVELPAGTNIDIRMIDGVDSEIARVGQTFKASLDQPVIVNGVTVVQRGADATVRLVDQKESGKLTGRSALTLNLVSVTVNGRPVDINTQTIQRESDSRGQQTAKTAAGVGAVGAIIGAIAGGGKGAAIGAASGAAAGAGAGVVLGGEKVKIPSETRLTFVLDTPVRI